MDEKLELIHNATLSIKKNPKVMSAFGALGFHSEDKYFASSEGSSIQQYIVQVYPYLRPRRWISEKGISRNRIYQVAPLRARLGIMFRRRTWAKMRRAFAMRCWSIWPRRR